MGKWCECFGMIYLTLILLKLNKNNIFKANQQGVVFKFAMTFYGGMGRKQGKQPVIIGLILRILLGKKTPRS